MTKRFIIALIIGLVLGLTGVIALNIFVDPTGFARASNLRGTAFCPASETHVSDRYSRVLRFESLNPETIVLGTSRVKIGFHKSDLIESGHPSNLFNFGINSMTATDMTDLLPHIARASHVKGLIVGIDYGMFARQRGWARREPIVWTNKNKVFSWLGPLYRAFLTIPVTRASIKSLRSGCFAYSFSLDGFPLPELEYRLVELDAPEKAAQKRPLSYRPMSEITDRGGSLSLFSKALGEVCALGRKIDLFVEPSHARYSEIRFKEGWWPDSENWKRKITHAVAELQEEGCEITLTDFSGYNHVTTFPFENGKNPSEFYVDLGHYTRNVGNMIIRHLSGVEKIIPVDSFGVTLTPDNVEAQINRIRDERNAYIKAR